MGRDDSERERDTEGPELLSPRIPYTCGVYCGVCPLRMHAQAETSMRVVPLVSVLWKMKLLS